MARTGWLSVKIMWPSVITAHGAGGLPVEKHYSLLFYVLATSNVISGWILTCDSSHSWWLYSAAPLGQQTASTMTWNLFQSYYPDNEPTSPCPILIMPSTWLGSDKYQFCKSLVWLDHGIEPTISHTQDQCSTDSATAPSRQFYLYTHNNAYLVNTY